MAKTHGAKDKHVEALDFIINVLKEHEKMLDKSIHELAMVTEQLDNIDALNYKLGKVEEKISIIQEELTNIASGRLNVANEALQVALKEEETQTQATSAKSPALVQGASTLILNCKQWGDFAVSANHSQMLFFSYEEDERVFRANTLKGKQMIRYTGALPNLSIIFKTWLSRQLDITEMSILEGFLDKTK
jgi:hypothetical protein